MTSSESVGTTYYEDEIEYINSCPRNILTAILGVGFLLIGMWITSTFSEGVANSVINIMTVCIAIAFVIKKTRIEKILGVKVTFATLLIISVVALLNIWLSAAVVYKDFLQGVSSVLSGHSEHSLMYSEMSIIATRLKSGISLEEATRGLPLNQYYNIFVYSSLLFLFGGINATNMCIWGTMHMSMCPVFVVLMLDKYGVRDTRHLKMAYFISMFQPLFLSVNTYNKVIIGEVLVMIALYIFVSTYDDPIKNLICLPIYGYLFWTVRLQYLLIAAILFIVCLVHNKMRVRVIIPVIALIIVSVVFFSRGGFGQIYQGLNIEGYHEGHDLSLSSIPARLVRSILPYFPISNIFDDQYWYFNIFCVLQEIMNITLWGLVFINRGKINISHAGTAIRNPFIIAAIALLLGGTLSELHTTYLSVGTMLLTSSCEEVSENRVACVYFMVFMAVIALNLVYLALGLQGSGVAGVSFS